MEFSRSDSPLVWLARQKHGPPRRVARSSVTPPEFKIVLIGSSGVGKTSLAVREAEDEFIDTSSWSSSSTSTVNPERYTTEVEVRQERVELTIFDTVGQERFMTLPTVFYRKSHAVLICFDVSHNRNSFEHIDKWFADVERNAPQEALILLVRTKSDLKTRFVTAQECKDKASELGVHMFETSAKMGTNVKAMFHLIASQLSEESRMYRAPERRVRIPQPVDLRAEHKKPQPESSSCFLISSPFEREEDEEEDEQGLAEVIFQHVNERAVSVAGGLKRRNRTSSATVTTTPAEALRPCMLGCGAITNVSTHELEECWLRAVPCSLNCGKILPMLDCAAHEREECEFRLMTCACGDKVQANMFNLHCEQDELPQTRQEMIHFLAKLFPKPTGHVNLREIKSVRDDDLQRALLTPEAKRTVAQAMQRFIGYSTSWEEEEDVVKKPERLLFSNVVSLQRRNQLMRRPVQRSNASTAIRPTTTTSEFEEVWHDLLDCKISPNLVSDGLLLQEQQNQQNHTRDVQVPLTLGSRVVTVRTIDFTDLQDLKLSNKLGAGSFGSVYLAKYRGAQVAVKHLHIQNLSERELLREAAVMTSCCHHPHILRFLGVCLTRPNICFVSEALLCSLEDWLRFDRRNVNEPLGEILRFAEEAASGLFHLHLESVVHRDIAARNLLLDTGTPRRVKVCDFGLARVVQQQRAVVDSSQNGMMSVSGGSFDMTGPLKWMAPECLRVKDGLNCFSFASDVYSFAITLWEMIARDAPYPELSATETAAQVLSTGLRPPKAKLRHSKQVEALLHSNSTVASHIVFLLERAWDGNAVNRPTMKQICTELGLLQDMLHNT